MCIARSRRARGLFLIALVSGIAAAQTGAVPVSGSGRDPAGRLEKLPAVSEVVVVTADVSKIDIAAPDPSQ